MVRRSLATAVVLAVVLLGAATARAQEAPARGATTPEITRVRGDVYMVRDGRECTVFVVTPEGIILADPLGRSTALWLREELRTRFQRDVRFLLHTWHDYARAAGSSVFNDTGEVVASSLFDEQLARARRSLPEHYRFALRVTLAYGGTHDVRLGGRTVTLVHVPASRTPEMSVLHFPGEHIVFAAGFPGLGTGPFTFGENSPSDVFAWIQALEPLEFDSLLLGDGRTVSRAEFDELGTYLSALRRAVAAGVREGRSLSEIQSAAVLDRFRASRHYAGRATQLAELYGAAGWASIQVSGGAVASHGQLWSEFCASYASCEGGGTVSAARFAMSVGVRRGFDITGELTLDGQTWSTRRTVSVDEEAATRRSRVALLARWAPRPSRLSLAFVGGASLTADDVQGLRRVKGVLLPSGGYHPIDENHLWLGATAGVDLERRLGRGMSVRLPVRITRVLHRGAAEYCDSTLDVQAGIELSFTLFQRVSFR